MNMEGIGLVASSLFVCISLVCLALFSYSRAANARQLISPDVDCTLASQHYSEMTKLWVYDNGSSIVRARLEAAYNEASTRYQRKCNP